MGTGDIPVHDVREGDLHFEDCLGDDFDKVGEYIPEELSQSPSTPAPEHPAEETPSSVEPRRKRSKTLARRTDLPWVRKLTAIKAKSSSSSQQTPQKQPSQPTRKSYQLAAQGVARSSSTNQGPPAIEEILSSSEGSPVKTPKPAVVPQESPVLESYFQEQGLEVFLDKLKAQVWFELFTNTQMGYSQPDVCLLYTSTSPRD